MKNPFKKIFDAAKTNYKLVIILAVIAVIAAALAISGIAKQKAAPNQGGVNVPENPTVLNELKIIAAQTGLAFSEPEKTEFLWIRTTGPETRTSATITGYQTTVGALAPAEIATVKEVFGQKNFSVDISNSLNGHNAVRSAFKKDGIVCVVESAGYLLNFNYYPLMPNPEGTIDIRIICGTIEENTKFSETNAKIGEMKDFDDCRKGGWPVLGAKPRQCIAKETIFFDQELCTAPTGEKMGIDEAAKIEERSECSREGSMTDRHFCDSQAGVWEIGILMSKPGCDPQCIIDIVKKTAKIDYRCQK